MREETEEPGENPGVRMRSTETQPTDNIYSRAGRSPWGEQHQPDSLRNTARESSQMVSHLVINPAQHGLTSVKRWEAVSPFRCEILYSLVWLAIEYGLVCEASAEDHLNLASETTCTHFIKYQQLYLYLVHNCSVWQMDYCWSESCGMNIKIELVLTSYWWRKTWS